MTTDVFVLAIADEKGCFMMKIVIPPDSLEKKHSFFLTSVIFLLAGVFFVFLLPSCTRYGLHNWVYRDAEAHYEIGSLSSRWRRIEISENDIAFYNKDFAASIQVNATCRKDYEDTSLEILTSHVLYGLTERKIIKQRRRTIDRRDALYTEFSAKLDGVAVKAALLILKKNVCIYDFTYITRPWNFGRGIGDFHRVIYGFKAVGS